MDVHKLRVIRDVMTKNKRQFRIPVYQRNYDWKFENCEKLFKDIIECSKENKVHFIGTIVYLNYCNSSALDDCLIIDGQQRITTLVLLIKALRDIAKKQENDTVKNDAEECLFNTNCDEVNRLKLKPIKKDNIQLKFLLDDRINEVNKKSNIYKNYETFLKLINSELEKGMNLSDIWNGLLNLELVEITLEKDKDNAQLIFESINSTGVDLTPSDLIRNYLLMDLKDSEEQENLYEKYWLYIEENLNSIDSNKTNLEKYFYDFLIMKNKSYIKETEIYEVFKKYCKENSYTKEDVLIELKKFSKYYKLLIGAENPEYSQEIVKACEMFRILNHNTAYPFFMLVLNDYENRIINEEELKRILNFFGIYALRRLICGIPSSNLRRFYSNLYYKIFKKEENKNKYYKAIEAYICTLKTEDVFPSDTLFKEHLKTENLYKKPSILKYLLEKVENYNSNETLNFDDLTIEHIMPQTLSKSWRDMLGKNYNIIHEKYLHTIGNLSVTGYNSKYSNESFEKKKELMREYKTNVIRLNESILNSEKWGKDEIEERANQIISIIMKIYSYPENIDKTIEFDIFVERKLGENIDNIKNLKMFGFKFLNDTYENLYYITILIDVAKILYEIDSNILKRIASSNYKYQNGTRIIFSNNSDNINNPAEIAEDVYMETNFNRESIEGLIQYLLKEYSINEDMFKFIYYKEK